jgi:uncharacterized SAM-binding protein YcdF (DUF218 family)
VLSKLVAFAINPLGTFLLATLLGALIAASSRRWRGFGRALGGLGLAWLILWSVPLASDALRGAIEDRAGPRTVEAVRAAPVAVVLGGGMADTELPRRPHPDLGDAADRVWHAARLYRAGKVQALLLSGGSFRPAGPPEAPAMRTLLLELGIPETAIVLSPRAVPPPRMHG